MYVDIKNDKHKIVSFNPWANAWTYTPRYKRELNPIPNYQGLVWFLRQFE